MKTYKSQLHVLMLSSFALASSVFAQTTTVSLGSVLPSITFIGSGCPANDGADAHWEGSNLVVSLSSMVAAKGQGISLLQSRKNCAITLDLKVPKGLSYALTGYTASGYDDLSDKDSRTLTLTNFFQGQSETGTAQDDEVGPQSAEFAVHHLNKVSELVWSPCNVDRAQTINAAIRVGNGGDRQKPSTATLETLRLAVRIKQCSGILK